MRAGLWPPLQTKMDRLKSMIKAFLRHLGMPSARTIPEVFIR